MAAEEGEVVQLTEKGEGDVIDTDDGGAIVKTGPDTSSPEEEAEFYRNLASEVDSITLGKLAEELLERLHYDQEARKDRDKQQAEGIKRTGLGGEAPGGASFPGASKVVHPMLSKGCVDFCARGVAELLPPGGPVKDYIPGTPSKARVEKARRKVRHMNWQFKKQMPNFRNELEQLLTQLPLGGSQYLRLVYDSRKRRPVPLFVAIDDVLLPSAASSYWTAERVTWVEHITSAEFESRIKSGMYIEVPINPPSAPPDKTESEEATDQIEGKKPDPYNEDGLRDVYLVETDIEGIEDNIESDGIKEDRPLPYLVSIDKHERRIVSIVRNWDQEDQNFEKMFWMVEFPFVPWRGAYSIGLTHLIGSLAGGATGAVRALLDSAHINNLPTLLKLKGANFVGQSQELNVAQVTEVEGGVVGDGDIRKLIMAVPFNEPSIVLLQLLGFLTSEADSVVRTTFEKLSEGKQDMPVGTTLALIEQGMKVMASIHARLHDSMDKVIQILHRINKMYTSDEEIVDETGELLAKREDYQGPEDVIPVSDPQIFSDVQRFAQMQMVAQRAMTMPMLYDLRKVEEMILERTKIPEAKELLLPAPIPQEMNAVNENAAASFGRPIAAFPEQDHLAHLQTHLDFMTSPFFGKNPLIAPKFLPAMMTHIAEHMVLWYVNATVQEVEKDTGVGMEELMKYNDPQTRGELDRTLAAASPEILQKGTKVFEKLPPIIQEAMAMVQQMNQMQMPQDPRAAAQVQIAQMRSQDTREKIAADQQKADKQIAADVQKAQMQAEADARGRQEELADRQLQRAHEAANEQTRQAAENFRSQADITSRERINREDNLTALTIADAEIQSGERVAEKTGTGNNPNPSGGDRK